MVKLKEGNVSAAIELFQVLLAAAIFCFFLFDCLSNWRNAYLPCKLSYILIMSLIKLM